MVGAYLSCTMETTGDDTRPLILQVTNSARVALDLQDIVNSHIDGKPTHRQQCHCQIITRFKSVDTKFYILLNSKKFEENDQIKGTSVNEDLTYSEIVSGLIAVSADSKQSVHPMVKSRWKITQRLDSSCSQWRGPRQNWSRDAGPLLVWFTFTHIYSEHFVFSVTVPM